MFVSSESSWHILSILAMYWNVVSRDLFSTLSWHLFLFSCCFLGSHEVVAAVIIMLHLLNLQGERSYVSRNQPSLDMNSSHLSLLLQVQNCTKLAIYKTKQAPKNTYIYYFLVLLRYVTKIFTSLNAWLWLLLWLIVATVAFSLAYPYNTPKPIILTLDLLQRQP